MLVLVEISDVSFLEYLIYAVWSREVVIVHVCIDANENCCLVVLPLLNRWDEVFDELGSWVWVGLAKLVQ